MNILLQLRKFLEMIRFSHTFFALPFALLALLMAWSATPTMEPSWELRLWQRGIEYFAPSSPTSATYTSNFIASSTPADSTPPVETSVKRAAGQADTTVNRAVPSETVSSETKSWRAWFGRQFPGFRWFDLVGVLSCMVCARSAAMAFNRIVDRRWDALNPRTQMRHLPSGTLSLRSAVVLTLVAAIGFVAATLLFLPRNPIPLFCSIPILLFLFGYSYTKRFTQWAHLWLGLADGFAPVGAWVVVRATCLELAPWLLAAVVMFWVSGFDIIYACQDTEFDRRSGLYSIPARWGNTAALHCAAVFHSIMILFLAGLPLAYPRFQTPFYGLGVAVIAILLFVEHRLVRPDDLQRVNIAFFHINAIVSFGLLLIGLVSLCAA